MWTYDEMNEVPEYAITEVDGKIEINKAAFTQQFFENEFHLEMDWESRTLPVLFNKLMEKGIVELQVRRILNREPQYKKLVPRGFGNTPWKVVKAFVLYLHAETEGKAMKYEMFVDYATSFNIMGVLYQKAKVVNESMY